MMQAINGERFFSYLNLSEAFYNLDLRSMAGLESFY